MGSGRYYARFSQSEVFPAPVEGGIAYTWLFEAFDANWFDDQPEPVNTDFLESYYERAELFVLELHIQPMEVGRFEPLPSLEKEALGDDEGEEWLIFEASPLEGRTLGEGELALTVYSNLFQPGVEASAKDVRRADPTAQSRLRKIVSTDHILDASENDVDDALALVAKTQIDWAVVYDVGQGNAIGLCNGQGSVQAYVDLGGGVHRNAHTYPSALRNFCFSTPPPIILSHWDFDHWSSASRDPRSLTMTWIAPRQSVGPTHVALMTNIMSSGTLLLVPQTLQARWRGQLYLELCTGRGRNHSGIALTLSEQTDGGGNLILFPGDARYPCLPSFASSTKYLSVVAPHHGGDMRNHAAPARSHQHCSRLVYSAGQGNTYGHPALVTRQDHDKAGWPDPLITLGASHYPIRETQNRIPGPLGHVFLGWTRRSAAPNLPCGGGSCQLEARQL
jgi:hypothetical protein